LVLFVSNNLVLDDTLGQHLCYKDVSIALIVGAKRHVVFDLFCRSSSGCACVCG